MGVLERIEAAQVRLGVICKDQRFKLRAGVPASTDDDDVYLSDTLNIARDRIVELERELEEAIAMITKFQMDTMEIRILSRKIFRAAGGNDEAGEGK